MKKYDLAIVIPAYDESGLFDTLDSVNQSALLFNGELLVAVVLNQSEGCAPEIDELHQKQYDQLMEGSTDYGFELQVIWEKDIPKKKAGVGYARKLGMDCAVSLLNDDALAVINLDADCTVAPNYCRAWKELFDQAEIDAATMEFQHPLDKLSEPEKRAIIQYEIHLRYYFRAQEFMGYPNPIQPIGSCMGVRSGFYKKIGGMNRRKAGEDFYFLQKCVLNGNWTYSKLTTVYPEARISDRVPFGTGKAMRDLLTSGKSYQTYNWQSFMMIRDFVKAIKEFSRDPKLEIWPIIPEELHAFLKNEQLDYNLCESVEHTGSSTALAKRLFRWFHPFRLMKLLHHLRDKHFPDQDVLSQANQLMKAQFGKQFEEEEALLSFMRNSF